MNLREPPGKAGVKKMFLILIAVLFQCVFFLVENSYAEGVETTISVEVEPEIQWSIRPDQLSTTNFPFAVTTNSNNGYMVMMSTVGDTTDLIYDNDEQIGIPTLTLPNGSSTVPAAMLNGYGYSLDGSNFKPVPSVSSDGDLVVTTDASVPDRKYEYNLLFGAKVDTYVPSGRYYKTFTITAIANTPITCESGYICYVRNGGEGETMDDQAVTSNTDVTLTAPKFYREGYGFAGWSTVVDGSGTNYGPHETIRVGDVSNSGMVLFARWVRSTGTFQEWRGCDTLSIGDIIALTDNRDGNVYTVVKLADGACWMTENLRLDLSDPDLEITPQNTNNPTADFMNTVNQHPESTSSFCTNNNAACQQTVNFNISGLDSTSADAYYSYGGYYNWYTATAGNGLRSTINSTSEKTDGDICPVGWSLPTGYDENDDLALLDIALGGTGKSQYQEVASKRWRAFPNNFLLSGQYNGNSATNLGETGNYHTASPYNYDSAYNLWIQQRRISLSPNSGYKTRGQTVRCLMRNYYTIKFDKNINKNVNGAMEDQNAPVGINTKLKKNTMTVPYSNHVGYRFIGWNTKANGSGDSYADEAEVNNLAETGEIVTLYAQWEEIQYADVTVNFTTGSLTEVILENSTYGSHTVTSTGDSVPLAIGETYRISMDLDADYDFLGWVTASSGTVSSATDSPTNFTITGTTSLTVNTRLRDTKLYLQNISPSACSTTPKSAYDIRDDETYTIRRMADGRCWMIDNLRLGSKALDQALTTENTNMSSDVSFTLPESGFVPQRYTPEIETSRNAAQVTHYGAGSGKNGVYYNFCAATAGTVCSETSPTGTSFDICPAGWRLPTGGGNSEFDRLMNSYETVAAIQDSFSVVLSGYYKADTMNPVTFMNDNSMYIWSSTPSNTTNKSYSLNISRTSKGKVGAVESNGLSIRCILKE